MCCLPLMKGRLLNLYNLREDLFNFCQKSLSWADRAYKMDQIMNESPTLRYVKGELINRRLKYRIQGHLFTSQ